MSILYEIETPRLILRPPRMEDAPAINASLNEVWEELQKWMSWAHDGENTLEKTEYYICEIVPQEIAKGGMPLRGFHKESGKFVISTGIHFRDGKYETGYWVAKDFLGKGYATESTNAVIRFAFNVLGAKEMHINYFEGNDKSRRVIEKLGFEENGIRPKAMKRCSNGEPLDIHDFVMRDKILLPPMEVHWRAIPA
jgi:RimJ/RimL family protein N-acetyltransferase